jgi:hypothetical protein
MNFNFITKFYKYLYLVLIFICNLIFMNCVGYVTQSSSQTNISDNNYEDYNVDELNSYGSWEHIDRYGSVWRPSVTGSWQPFSYGDWMYDGSDWVWDSYEPYGWIVYHYGNWYYDPFYGWVWIPGRTWSRARVIWIQYDNYIGWAPQPPTGVYWDDPWANSQIDAWNVVEARDFTREGISQYRVSRPYKNRDTDNQRIIRQQPDRRQIEGYTGRPVQRVEMQRKDVKVGNGKLYRMDPPKEKINQTQPKRERVKKEITKTVDKKEVDEKNKPRRVPEKKKEKEEKK